MINSFKAHDNIAKLKFDIELEHDKKVYCFFGENGAGKTRLLENMAHMLVYVHKRFKDEDGNFFLKIYSQKTTVNSINGSNSHINSLDGTPHFVGEVVLKNLSRMNVELNKSTIVFNQRNYEQHDGYYHKSILRLGIDSDISFNLPICFISAENRGYVKNLSSNPELLSCNEELFGKARNASLSSMHFTDSSYYDFDKNKSLADWIATRAIMNKDTVPFDSKQALAELDSLFSILSPLMPREISFYNKNGSMNILYNAPKLEVAGVAIDKLPTGVISLMRILQEIISCYGAWNGILDEKERADDILQMEGIVFIDEIEAHMHPKWQARIIQLLRESFPKTTFYIATHSPAIVATTEEGEAYELKRDGEDVTAQVLGDPKSWYLEDIFSAGFDVRLPKRQKGIVMKNAAPLMML